MFWVQRSHFLFLFFFWDLLPKEREKLHTRAKFCKFVQEDKDVQLNCERPLWKLKSSIYQFEQWHVMSLIYKFSAVNQQQIKNEDFSLRIIKY